MLAAMADSYVAGSCDDQAPSDRVSAMITEDKMNAAVTLAFENWFRGTKKCEWGAEHTKIAVGFAREYVRVCFSVATATNGDGE